MRAHPLAARSSPPMLVIGGSDDEEFFVDRGNTPDSASKAAARKPGCYGTGFCGTTKEGSGSRGSGGNRLEKQWGDGERLWAT